MKRFMIYIAILTSIFLIPLFLNSDWYQQRVNPLNYWTKEEKKLQESIEFNRDQISSCMLEIKKLQMNHAIEIRQLILSGLTPQEAGEQYKSEFQLSVEICKMFQSSLESAERELDIARLERAKISK